MYIIPEPQEMEFLEGTYTIRFDHKIVVDVSCGPEAYEYAKMLQEELRACMGYGPAVTRGRSGKTAVTLTVDAALGEEEYRLTAGVDGIGITGGANRGLLYGVQTLRQIVRQAGNIVAHMTLKQ